MHSVHFLGSITNVPFFSEIATFGHSGSQAEQLVHCEATIFNAIGFSCQREFDVAQAAAIRAPWRISASPRATCSISPLFTLSRYDLNQVIADFSMNSWAY